MDARRLTERGYKQARIRLQCARDQIAHATGRFGPRNRAARAKHMMFAVNHLFEALRWRAIARAARRGEP
jgi:hypothetical protein